MDDHAHAHAHVSRAVQTDIQGLCKDKAAIPAALIPRLDTTTPPDDASQNASRPAPSAAALEHTTQTSMHLAPKPNPNKARIHPTAALGNAPEDPPSPPPTEAIMSPLPAANTLHAGHTPIIPGALSPLPKSASGPATPDFDQGLSGPLTLPPQPGDGTADTISLSVLDHQLEKLRMAQESASEHAPEMVPDDAASRHDDENEPLSRKSSKESQPLSPDEIVDGVILKKPRMNMGAPLGQA